MTPTRLLARYATDLAWKDLPDPVRAEARRALLNWFGCALGAVAPPMPRSSARSASPAGPGWQATSGAWSRGARQC